MKTDRTYRWRVLDRGRARATSTPFTEAQVPETADELLDQFNRTPSVG